MFSGDALFVGEVGRPDLLGDEQTEALICLLYETVSQRFAALPDDVIVYPGHTAGSSCGRKIGDAPQTTIGAERIGNYAFRARDRETFVRQVLADMPAPPSYYPVLKRINARGATLLDDLPQPVPLTPDRLSALAGGGALIVDTRPVEEFGEEHIPGAMFAGFGTNFHAWLGWIAPYDRDLVLVLTKEAPLRYVLTALRQIGIDRVAGYLEGGMLAWLVAGSATAALPRMTVSELAANQRDAARRPVLDVRAVDEWNAGHIAGAHHLYAGEIAQGALPARLLDPAAPAAVICGTGYRATVAASLLATRGYTNLISVVGGMTAWDDANLPVTRDAIDEENHVRTLDA